MIVVNPKIFDPKNIYNFVDASVIHLITKCQLLTKEKEYWLFYFIKDDFWTSLSSLYNVNIEQDFLGFPSIKKNIRHTIEAFIDLYNLYNDKDYLIVLEYCSKMRKDAGKYEKYLYRNEFSIQSKCNIAKSYGGNFQEYLDIARDSNNYIHPNVFLNVISSDNVDEKRKILSELLNSYLSLLTNSYELILKKYHNNEQPYLGCCERGNCCLCYKEEQKKFKYYIDNQLLMNIYPSMYSYNQINYNW